MPRKENAWSQQLRAHIRQFFLGRDSALNLAIVRIVVLGTILSQLHVHAFMWIARLPAELQTVPNGSQHLLHAIPLNETTALTSITVCAVACIFGMIGLFSRTSCAIAALSGVYALMIGHLMPSPPHNHNLIWFAAILACSRCGDALSIDSLIRALRQAHDGYSTRVCRARCYAIPLRMMWILCGVIYFFPGLWKLTRGRSEWIAGHGLIKAIRYKWALLGGWISPIRIDTVPELCKVAQFATISFEILFIVAIIFPLTRRVAATAGLVFHNATTSVMHVSFYWLQTCYVALIDWHALILRAGKIGKKRRTILRFENACAGCRKSVALLRAVDLRRANIFTSATGDNANETVDLHAALTAPKSSEPHIGRLPMPFGFFKNAFCQLLKMLHRSTNQNMDGASESRYLRPSLNYVPVLAVGCMVILLAVRAGAHDDEGAWPFACYPQYFIDKEHVERLAMSLVSSDGKQRDIDLTKEWSFLSDFVNRKWSYVWPGRTHSSPDRIPILRATWSVLVQDHPDWQQATAVRFYEESCSTDPNRFRHGPDSKSLLYEMQLH